MNSNFNLFEWRPDASLHFPDVNAPSDNMIKVFFSKAL